MTFIWCESCSVVVLSCFVIRGCVCICGCFDNCMGVFGNTCTCIYCVFVLFRLCIGPPLWSSGQSFWLQIQRSRVRFPALPDFLSSSGSGTGSTQPREVN